jgi:putative membrane protein
MDYTRKKRRRESDVLKGAAAGAVGGLVASWVMNEFSSVVQKVAESVSDGHNRKSQGSGQEQQEDPTMTTAEKISETVAGMRLNREQKKKGGTVVHYAFGVLMGAVYGAAAEALPPVRSLAGLPYGAALFVGADEVALPVLGLSKKPTEYPLSRHLSGLGQHLVYGVTIEFVRRNLRDRL